MVDYRIIVQIDPSAAVSGGDKVESKLNAIQDKATRLQGAIDRALKFEGADKAASSLTDVAENAASMGSAADKAASSTAALTSRVRDSDSSLRQMAQAVLQTDAALKAEAISAARSTTAQSQLATATATATAAARTQATVGAASAVEMASFEAKAIKAAMAQAGLTEAQARSALGFKAAASAENEAASAVEQAAKKVVNAHGGMTGSSIKVRESLVLMREALRGDTTRMFGSATILAGAFGLMTSSILLTLAAVAALAAPFVIFIAAMSKGSAEAAKLNNALTVTNNYVGLTSDQVRGLGRAVATATDEGITKTNALLTYLISTGKVTKDSLEAVAEASLRLSKLTGEDAKKISGELVQSFSDAAKGASDLNDKYHYLTLAEYDQIDALQKAGDKQGAFTLSMKLLRDDLAKSTVDMGYFERAIHAVGGAFDFAWNKLKDFGKTAPLAAQIVQDTANLAKYNERLAKNPGDTSAFFDAEQLKSKIQRESALMRQQTEDAKTKAEAAQTQQAGIEARRYLESVDTQLGGSKERMLQEITDYKGKVAAALKANPADKVALADQENMAERIAAIRKKFDKMDYGRQKRDPVADESTKLAAEAAANRQVAEAFDLTTAAGFKANAMKQAAIQAARLHTDASRFEAAELLVAVTADEASGSKSLATMRERITAQTDVNKVMAETGLSTSEATRIVKDNLEVMQHQAAQANATAKDYKIETGIIEDLRQAQHDLNLTIVEGQIIDANNKQRDINDDLRVQLDLINATNRERRVALTIAKTMAELRAKGLTDDQIKSDPNAQGLLSSRTKGANLEQDIQDGFTDAIKNQQYYIQLLDEMQNRTSAATSDMAGSFGKLGQAIQGLTDLYVNYGKTTEEIELKRMEAIKAADGNQARIALANSVALDGQRQSELKYYGDSLGAAKSFFGQKTVMYKLLEAGEKAFRLVEFALSIQSMLQHTTEAAVVVGTETAKTGAVVAGSTVRASAKAAEGIAGIFADLGPFAFPVAAAAIAFMVAAGVSIAGGAGGGAIPGANDASQRQKTQGSGSVLGDAAAKSDSIAKSLANVEAHTNTQLEFSNDMVKALRSIDGNIGTLTRTLARQLQLGSGVFSTSGLGLGQSSTGPGLLTKLFNPLSLVFPSLFGSTKNTTLQDQGIEFGSNTLASILSGGLNANAYQQTATETKKKFFGITYSDKTSTSTTSEQLGNDVINQMTAIVSSLRTGVLAAAGALGIKGAEATLDAMTIDLGKLSLKDMTGQQIQDALNALFGKLADQMSEAAAPFITELQKVGEGAFDTLTRVARDYQVVDVTLSEIGRTFGALGVDSVKAREDLIDLSGGIDNFTQQASDFASKFMTDQERMAPVAIAVHKALDALGYGAITTKEQFRQLVLSLDLTTETGRTTYATLMAIAPAFASLTDYVDALTSNNDAVNKARQNLSDAYDRESKAITDTKNKFDGFVVSLKNFRQQLDTGPEAQLSPLDAYNSSRSLFETTRAAAQGGDQTAISNFPSVAQAFLTASKNYNSTSVKYFQDLSLVKSATDQVAQFSQEQSDLAAKQLAALDNLVSNLIDLNKNVLSVRDAILALGSALTAQQAAIQSAINPAPSAPSAPPSVPANDNTFNASSYLNTNPDVAGAYSDYAANQPTWATSGFGLGDTMEQFAADHYRIAGQAEGRRPYAKGGSWTNGIVDKMVPFNDNEMGEAGSEAVVPLVRMADGNLGVRSAQSSRQGGPSNEQVLAELQAIRTELRAANIQRGAVAKDHSKRLNDLNDGVETLGKRYRAATK